MREILASSVVLAFLLAGQVAPARPNSEDCCAENSYRSRGLWVRFEWGTTAERVEEIAAELGSVVYVYFGDYMGPFYWICAPWDQELVVAEIIETYPEVRYARVAETRCRPDEPRCECCPEGLVCPELPPCHPSYQVPDGDGDEFPDRCDACTDSDGDLFGDPGFRGRCPTDNCPDTPNPDQGDFDEDGLGDACDHRLTICHNPPSQSDRPQTIHVNDAAFLTHQVHSDTLGPCDTSNPCNVPFTRVLHTWSGFWAERFEVIDDEDAWCDLWSELYGGYYYPLPCDTTLVDFETEVAVVAGIGARGNGCFNVNVTCIRKPAGVGNIWVEVIERQPGPYCICAAAVVNPLEIVKMPRFGTRRISFKKRIEILDCE